MPTVQAVPRSSARSAARTMLSPALLPTSDAPSLLAFYHIPKTGGSTVREWLLRNSGVRSKKLWPRRLRGSMRYYETRCFMCLQFGAALHPSACPEKALRLCRSTSSWQPGGRLKPGGFNPVSDTWRANGTIAVEFHGSSGDFFVEHVLPAAPRLRRLYASAHGRVVFAAVLREPTELLFSTYQMWPPRVERGGAAVPFPDWVRGAAGLQMGLLTNPVCTNSTLQTGQHNLCGCGEALRRDALSTLNHFDVLGVTACLPAFFDATERALGLPPDAPHVRLARRAHKGNATAGPMRAVPRCTDDCPSKDAKAWSWETLDAAARANTLAAARCDEQVYRMALRRAAAAARALSPSRRSSKGGGGAPVDAINETTCTAAATTSHFRQQRERRADRTRTVV